VKRRKVIVRIVDLDQFEKSAAGVIDDTHPARIPVRFDDAAENVQFPPSRLRIDLRRLLEKLRQKDGVGVVLFDDQFDDGIGIVDEIENEDGLDDVGSKDRGRQRRGKLGRLAERRETSDAADEPNRGTVVAPLDDGDAIDGRDVEMRHRQIATIADDHAILGDQIRFTPSPPCIAEKVKRKNDDREQDERQ
jgi:hypothetical protein